MPPTNNPAAALGLAWTQSIRWANVVSIAEVNGPTLEARFAAAQDAVAAKGGGVVFFPAGVYRFSDFIALKDGVVIRGADPQGSPSAKDDAYDLPTRFEFPKYEPEFHGEGTPIDTAFKGIRLENPAKASCCGVVHVAINRGHIHLGEGPDHQCGRNRIVYGCVLRNAAAADPAIPDRAIVQHAWQRFTARHHAAVHVCTAENVLVANNRLPFSGDDNFMMKGYILSAGKDRPLVPHDVVFDYDNRPGLYINNFAIGGQGGSGGDGTPETHPYGFRKGIVIRDNFICCTGRSAIAFCGDGVVCADNVVHFKPKIPRPTVTGKEVSRGSSTNDNRAVQMRGWRWTVSGNTYEVYRNVAADGKYEINDGEGLMHEDHVNSTVLDSRLIHNKGNAYLAIFKTGGIDGLLVEDNDIRTRGGIAAIYVVADRNSGRFACRNVQILGNTTSGSGIEIAGHPAENNLVANNVHIGPNGRLVNRAQARLENNRGYTVVGK